MAILVVEPDGNRACFITSEPCYLSVKRLLLTLLDAVGEPVGDTDFQELLFLYTRECETAPTYEFVPHKFGAFSFTSYADKRKLIAEGLLEEDDQNWSLTESGRAATQKQPVELLRVAEFCRRHSGLRGNALIVEQCQRDQGILITRTSCRLSRRHGRVSRRRDRSGSHPGW
ncbi:MAG TPA: hypothetical protein VIT91_10845 [Chthoniobacterales bacterium]